MNITLGMSLTAGRNKPASGGGITCVLTGPSTYTTGDDFNVTATFSESVTGVVAADLVTSEVMQVSIIGSGAVYTFTLNDDFEEFPSIDITYPANGTNEGNAVSNTLTVNLA